jgi:hypothetical protein
MPWLRRLTTSLSPKRPGFDTRPEYVGYVVGKVTLGQVLARALRTSPVSIIPPNRHTVKSVLTDTGWSVNFDEPAIWQRDPLYFTLALTRRTHPYSERSTGSRVLPLLRVAVRKCGMIGCFSSLASCTVYYSSLPGIFHYSLMLMFFCYTVYVHLVTKAAMKTEQKLQQGGKDRIQIEKLG